MKAVRVGDAADLGKLTVEVQMRFGIRRGTQRALHNIAIEIEDDDVLRRQRRIIDAAGFDGPQATSAVDSGNIPPRQTDEAAGDEGMIGCTNLGAEIRKEHGRK